MEGAAAELVKVMLLGVKVDALGSFPVLKGKSFSSDIVENDLRLQCEVMS